jgi:hypothetical protein
MSMRAKMTIHSIKSMVCGLLLAACSGSKGSPSADDVGDGSRPPDTDGDAPIESEGGMDGAGDYAIGLDWESGVFVQSLWRGDQQSYLIINDRGADVDVFVDAVRVFDEAEHERLAGPWTVPAHSHREFAGSQLHVPEGIELVSWRAGTSSLGLERALVRRPRATTAAVVSNHGVNGSGGNSAGQIESDFVVAPGPAFTVTYLVPPGELSLSAHTDAELGMPFFDVVAVRSDTVTVQTTPTGFVVEVPYANGASALDEDYHEPPTDADFARVEVDVRLPDGTSDALGATVDGFYCYTFDEKHRCSSGYGMSRAFPLRE